MGDALKSQKKGLKMDVTRMGKCTAKLYRVCVEETAVQNEERLCVEETIESSCVEETICETGPLGK